MKFETDVLGHLRCWMGRSQLRTPAGATWDGDERGDGSTRITVTFPASVFDGNFQDARPSNAVILTVTAPILGSDRSVV